jgi:hypothetical protein
VFVKQLRRKVISSHTGIDVSCPLARQSVEEIVGKHPFLARGRASFDSDPKRLEHQLTFRLTVEKEK